MKKWWQNTEIFLQVFHKVTFLGGRDFFILFPDNSVIQVVNKNGLSVRLATHANSDVQYSGLIKVQPNGCSEQCYEHVMNRL